MYALIVYSVVALFVLCEAANVEKRNEGCDELVSCEDPVIQYLYANASEMAAFSQNETYIQLCQDNTQFQSCIDDKRDSCNDSRILSTIRGHKDILDYLCTEAGRGELNIFADSSCVSDQGAIIRVEQGISECGVNFYENFFMIVNNHRDSGGNMSTLNVCPAVDRYVSCIWSSMENHCDNAFSNFYNKIWILAYRLQAQRFPCDV